MQEIVKRIKNEIKVVLKDDGLRPYFDDDKESRQCYIVTVKYKGKSCSYCFGDSIANTESGEKPDIDGILEIMSSDYYYTKEQYPDYEDFANEFGYEVDSRKGEKIYDKCIKLGEKLHKIFSDSDIEILREELDL